MNRRTLVLAVVLAALLVACGSGVATIGPVGTGGSGPPSAATAGAPSAVASQAPEEAAAALVPVVDPSQTVTAGATRGAFAVILLGGFGQVQATGQAECQWDRDLSPPTFRSLKTSPVRLMGEQVVVGVDHTPTLDRATAARYIPKGGLSWDPTPVGDAMVARSTDLEIDTGAAVPDGADPTTYTATLGGRPDTTSLDVTVAWHCEQPTSAPNASAPEASAEAPTPVCPPRLSGSPAPIGPLVLSSATDQADGAPFSSDFTTCTDEGASDGDWAVPDTALAASGKAPLTLSFSGPGTLFDVAAFYTPASTDTAPTNMLSLTVRPGTTPSTYLVDPPPAGDWAVVVSAGIADPDHGFVENGTFIYRVKVTK